MFDTPHNRFRKVRIDGYSFWVDPASGRVLPAVAGGADGDDDGDNTPPATFTQADVDRLMGRTRAEARSAAANELAEQLGCTVEEAKTKLADLAAAEESRKDDLTKAQEAAAAAQAQAAEAAARAAQADAERVRTLALVAGNVNPAHLTDALRLLDAPADADAEALTAAVTGLAERLPALFTTPTAPAPAGGRVPTPHTPPGSTGGGQSAEERAKARFQATQNPLAKTA